MKITRPDIIVTDPDGEYLLLVEVKRETVESRIPEAIEQMKRTMASFDCSLGLVVVGEKIILLRDSLEKYGGESVRVVGEAKLPDSLLPSPDRYWQDNPDFEFEARVQQWLENLQLGIDLDRLPEDLKTLLDGPILRLLRVGEVRAAGPRWSRATK
jgi:Type I restriction enzyme R protein N terminus (HSDR_N)